MLTTQDLQWYAVRTRSRFEKVVHDRLVRQGIDSLLPLCTRTSQWKGHTKRIKWPLFSGYCFARFEVDQQGTVIQVPGVVEIIGTGGVLEAIPATEIAAVQRLITSGETYKIHPFPFEEGMLVRVIQGPLVGLEGKCVQSIGTCRLLISVNLIRQSAAVDIAAEDVARLEEQASLAAQ